MKIFIVLTAYLLDLILGDPRWLPHPVKIIGAFIEQLEKLLYPCKNKKLAGIILTFTVVSLSFLSSWFLINVCLSISPYIGIALSVVVVYTTLSIKDLKVESMEVYHALKQSDRELSSARKKLSMIVGRDTENLDRKEIIRATVESIAENTVDGIISPLFYAFIGGVPLAVAYKAVNTLDSMIGYKNDKYIEFGWAAARLDDIVNFIPAIFSSVLIPGASFLTGNNTTNSLRVIFRDGIKHPISGIPESAVAGALQVKLGGINFYSSVPVQKPFLGDDITPLEEKHIKEAINIAYICSLIAVISGVVLCQWI